MLIRTPLYELHIEQGAKFVPFAGYEMPLQFNAGIVAEHLHTRRWAGLFDISHMGQIRLIGKEAAVSLEKLVPSDILRVKPLQQVYTVFTNTDGGIIDDIIVSNLKNEYLLVVNAARKQRDYMHLQSVLQDNCQIELLEDHALLALQGPYARAVLTRVAPDISTLPYMQSMYTKISNIRCLVSCSGYTGEDGFEISVSSSFVKEVANLLLTQEEVSPVGLGARDTLRLEAGFCLYGHDINSNTTPIEAKLSWVINKVRRPGGDRANGYLGAEKIVKQLASGVDFMRSGFLPDGRVPVREGAQLIDQDGNEMGHVTSGGYSPSLQKPIAMGYVNTSVVNSDKRIFARVRNKLLPVSIATLPFVPKKYYSATN